MADESRPPFVLPDSVLRRRRGLLAGAMTNPPPHQWAENLELLSAEGRLTSVEDMLALMRSELDRLQEQINPDDEPDRHAEAVLAAATASALGDRRLPVLRFSIILGYLYGRLTKPGEKSISESVRALLQLRMDRERKARGGKSGRTLSLREFEEAWTEWVLAGSKGKKDDFDSRMANRFSVSKKTIETERLKLQREYKKNLQSTQGNP